MGERRRSAAAVNVKAFWTFWKPYNERFFRTDFRVAGAVSALFRAFDQASQASGASGA